MEQQLRQFSTAVQEIVALLRELQANTSQARSILEHPIDPAKWADTDLAEVQGRRQQQRDEDQRLLEDLKRIVTELNDAVAAAGQVPTAVPDRLHGLLDETKRRCGPVVAASLHDAVLHFAEGLLSQIYQVAQLTVTPIASGHSLPPEQLLPQPLPSGDLGDIQPRPRIIGDESWPAGLDDDQWMMIRGWTYLDAVYSGTGMRLPELEDLRHRLATEHATARRTTSVDAPETLHDFLLTQQEAAERLGIAKGTFSKLKNSKYCPKWCGGAENQQRLFEGKEIAGVIRFSKSKIAELNRLKHSSDDRHRLRDDRRAAKRTNVDIRRAGLET